MQYVSFERLMQVSLYSIVHLLPYLFVALYTMRSHLRYSMRTTVLITMAVSVIQVIIGISVILTPSSITWLISILSTLIYGAFFFWAIKAHTGKILFMLLILSNISNFVVVGTKFFEAVIFPQFSSITYGWTFSIVTIFVQICVLPPFFLFSIKQIKPVVDDFHDDSTWRYLWLIPATFYLIWNYTIYTSNIGESASDIALKPISFFYILIINVGAMFVYYIIVLMLREHSKNLILEMENYHLNMQEMQYTKLKDRMEDTRKARHDLRQHIAVLVSCVEKEDYNRLREYLMEYVKSLDVENPLVFCKHFAINSVLTYYAQIAKENGIDFDCQFNLPSEIRIPDIDLVVVMGNLIENAIDGCCTQMDGERSIKVRGGMQNGTMLAFTVDNTYAQEVKGHGVNGFMSSKHKGEGTGIVSVKSIAMRHNGVAEFRYDGRVFFASVMMSY